MMGRTRVGSRRRRGDTRSCRHRNTPGQSRVRDLHSRGRHRRHRRRNPASGRSGARNAPPSAPSPPRTTSQPGGRAVSSSLFAACRHPSTWGTGWSASSTPLKMRPGVVVSHFLLSGVTALPRPCLALLTLFSVPALSPAAPSAAGPHERRRGHCAVRRLLLEKEFSGAPRRDRRAWGADLRPRRQASATSAPHHRDCRRSPYSMRNLTARRQWNGKEKRRSPKV